MIKQGIVVSRNENKVSIILDNIGIMIQDVIISKHLYEDVFVDDKVLIACLDKVSNCVVIGVIE